MLPHPFITTGASPSASRIDELRLRGYDDTRQGRAAPTRFLNDAERDAYTDGVARAQADGEAATLEQRLVRMLEDSLEFWNPDQEAKDLRRAGRNNAALNVLEWKRKVEALIEEARGGAAAP